jgi:hypothetical protein
MAALASPVSVTVVGDEFTRSTFLAQEPMFPTGAGVVA